MNILYSVIFFCALTALLTYIGIRNKAKSWRGVVTEIRRYSYMRNDVLQEDVVIRYRTDDGKARKLKLTPWAYNKYYPQLVVGDTLVKAAGESMARKETPPAKPV